METFYRVQRKKTGILMVGNEPYGGKWNFDHENRNKYDSKVPLPPTSTVLNDLTETYKRILKANIQTIGTIDAQHFIWPINRKQALTVLDEFIKYRLPCFGTYQDALTTVDKFLFHSRISFALNTKMLHPLEVVNACIEDWHNNPERITINQLEGFIRQIIGWREYMRGIYWLKMPGYAHLNYFNHKQKLPSWFWTGNTKMKCLQHTIGRSLDSAYAHHIQRLMVTGNFALLAGIHPDEIDAWYLGIYIDAIEWVEITNTRGMSQFADGGIVGSKPYVSSAAYIDKMGNYCSQCFYDKKEKIGEKACPFNALYWHFYQRNEDKLGKNPRIGMMYQTWKKMNPEMQKQIILQADANLNRIEQL
jgi:deoxyribodipyrimidine photolyase-related protein